MVYPRAIYSKHCIHCGIPFFTYSADAILCPKCVEESGPEYREKGTIFGMQPIASDSIDQLVQLHAVTNRRGADETVHIARERDILRAPKKPIKALCGNPLKYVSNVRPLAEPGRVSIFETHKEGESKWCPACERRLRKIIGAARLHSFGVIVREGYPMVLGYEPPKEQKDTTE